METAAGLEVACLFIHEKKNKNISIFLGFSKSTGTNVKMGKTPTGILIVSIFLEVIWAMRGISGCRSDWWLLQVDWEVCRSHTIVVDQCSIGERTVEVHQAFVMDSWDTW